jgi:alpha-beta hydrolase superfamily lysophospholipase
MPNVNHAQCDRYDDADELMKHQTDSFQADDGLNIYCQSWIPDSPAALVVLSHGYAEHSGRYQHVVDALLAQRYAVYALDHRNHGQSDGERGYVTDFSALVKDLHRFVTQTKAAHPGLKTILFGHSMGAAVSLHYVLEHPKEIDLLVVTAPYLIDGGNVSPLLMKASRIIAMLTPRLPVKVIDSSAISRDTVVVADYDNDPLNHRGKVRARTGLELLSAGPQVFQRADEISLPIMIMHGDADSIASVDGSHQLHQSIASADKSIQIFHGLYHEILNEPEKDQILSDIVRWMQNRV